MIIAAADVMEKQGFDPHSSLYAEALDVASLCFKMTYLQRSLRGIPAIVRHANTLSLQIFETAHTPAFLPFLFKHGEAFRRWREEAGAALRTPLSLPAAQGDLFDNSEPQRAPDRKPRRRRPGPAP